MQSSSSLARAATGIQGLDTILRGGLIVGGVYMVMGAPGTGKTVLGSQLCFSAANRGGSAVYVTLLAESHGRLVANLRSLSFFDESLVSTRIHYLAGYGILEENGLAGLLATLQRLVTEKQATMLVLDGLGAMLDFAEGEIEVKKFLQELQFFAALTGCTTIILSGRKRAQDEALLSLADGVIELSHTMGCFRGARELQVTKSNGEPILEGAHTYLIGREGFVAYPRLEALEVEPAGISAAATHERLSFGIPDLDAMLNNGVFRGSSTLIQGPTGSGKSVFGLHYLHADPQAVGVYFGYGRSRDEVLAVGDTLGLDLRARFEAGRLIVALETFETPLDVAAARIIDSASDSGAARVFIDDLEYFESAVRARARLRPVMMSLSAILAARGVTTVMALETSSSPATAETPEFPTGFADNHVFLRIEEFDGELRQLCHIGKVRRSGFDNHIRAFHITSHGVTFDPLPGQAAMGARGRARRRRGWGLRDARAHSDR